MKNFKIKAVKALILLTVSVCLIVGLNVVADADSNTYYSGSGYIESKTLTNPDASGNIYYHYIDENYNNQGYGRVDKVVFNAADSEGAIAQAYTYWGSTSILSTLDSFINADYTTDPSNPVLSRKKRHVIYNSSGNYTERRTYYSDASNRIQSKTFASADTNGNVYYRYINENFNNQGYGRTDRKVFAAADGEGAIAQTYTYWGSTSVVNTLTSYVSANYSNYTNPVFTTRIRHVIYDSGGNYTERRTYYNDGTNRIQSKTFASADTNGNVYYRYINENWASQGYGRIDVSQLATANTNGEIAFEYSYYTGLAQAHYVYTYTDTARTSLYGTYEYATDGTFLQFIPAGTTVEYYTSTLMKRKIESGTSDIYEYLDEDWLSQGYGRITLIYDGSGNDYWTYTWGSTQVTIEEFSGTYAPATDSAVWNDVVTSERVATYIYDHHNVQVDLNTTTNGWALREKTEYASDGVTVSAEYEYDTSGRMIREYHTGDNYFNTYDYYTGAYSTVVHYKYEYGFVGDTALTAHGDVQKDTADTKFGTASALFDGSGDYLSIADSDDWDVCGSSTDSWTIDLWVKHATHTGAERYISQGTAGNALWSLWHYDGSGIQFIAENGGLILQTNFGGEITDTNWHHITLVKVGDEWGIYKDGTQVAYTQDSDTTTFDGGLFIGSNPVGTTSFNGNMDEIRIVNGNPFGAAPDSSSTDTLTVPTAAHTFGSNDVFLAHNDGTDGSQSFTATARVESLIKTYEYDTSSNLIRVIYSQGTAEYYSTSPFLLMRNVDQGSSDVYEYLNEDWNSQGYGRVTLLSDVSEGTYSTYDWGTSQVTINAYQGAYEFNTGDNVRIDVTASERTDRFIYDHGSEQASLDTATNGWIMRQHSVYSTDGTTLTEEYIYDTTGRLTRNDDVSANRYYTYDYIGSTSTIEKKYEYQRNNSTLLTTYWYLASDFYYKEDHAANRIYTYFTAGGNDYINTQLDSDGTFTEYRYNSSNVLVGADRYSADRSTVQKLDSSLNVVETITPSPQFARGENLPWISYGYDIGTATLGSEAGSHYGFSSQAGFDALVDRMRKRQGDYIRVFLFNDLRAGVTFSGSNPTGFNSNVYADMDALIEVAEMLGVKLLPVLLDFKMADGVSNESGTAVGEHLDLITNTDTTNRDNLISLLGDFVDHYSSSDVIYAWEVMNEPEEIYLNTSANLTQTKSFISALISEVQAEDTDTPVTLGNQDRLSMINNWTDVGLDIYQYHYYNRFENESKPLNYAYSNMSTAVGGRPVIVGEVDPTQDGDNSQTVLDKLNTIYGDGYSGAFFWEDDSSTYTISDAMYEQMKSWIYSLSGTSDELYSPSGLLKRHTEANDDMYEYLDEDWLTQGYGRVITAYDESEMTYYTFSWGTTQVTVNEYLGVYAPTTGSAVQSDVVQTERVSTIIYDHVNEQVDLDTSSNGWVMRAKGDYSTDGVTLTDLYTYDATGRLTRADHYTIDRFYVYTYYGSPYASQVQYLYEYELSTTTLLATFEYATDGTLIRVIYGSDVIETYASTLMKRKIEGSTNNIYEYLDEDYFVPGVGAQGYGRYALIYTDTNTTYKTYSWGVTQVTLEEYSGVYAPATDSAILSDVDQGERTVTYIYDHNGEEVDLNTATNGWILRYKIVYDTDGVTMVEEYTYYASGRLETKEVMVETDTQAETDLQGDHVIYYFLDEDAGSGYGRIYRIDNITENWYYDITYVDPNDPNNSTIVSKIRKDLDTDVIIYLEEKYTSDRIKRVLDDGDIYEYLDENWISQGYGRISLMYDSSYTTYSTYDWGVPQSTQVTVAEYSGEYSVFAGDPLRHDVVQSERTTVYVYDHYNEQVDLNLGTNNWVIRQKSVYTTDGVTLTDQYVYDTTGRLIRDDHIPQDRYYTYIYYDSPNQFSIRYKYEYVRSTDTLLSTYSYYLTSQRMQSQKLETADAGGYIYYHYLDESFYDNGTSADTSDDFGRVDSQVRQTADGNGAVGYELDYSTGTDRVVTKRCYQSANISDLQNPQYTTLIVTITYYDDTDNYMESQTYASQDTNGNVYYHYMNENFYGTGTATDPYYGRADSQVAASVDGDGAIAYEFDYSTGTDRVVTKRCYQSASITDPTNPVYTTLLVTYTYNDNTANRVETKDVLVETSGEHAGDHVMYYYLDEDAGSGYGRISRIDNYTDGVYYLYTYLNPSDPNDSTLSSVEIRNISNDTLIYSETYYASGRLHEKTYGSADTYGNLYYEYLDEDFYGSGTTEDPYYGRLVRVQQASDGHVFKTVSFQGSTALKDEVDEFDDLAETNWLNTYWYFNDSNNYLYQKLELSGDAYEYYNNDGGGRGYGWLSKQWNPQICNNGTPTDPNDDYFMGYSVKSLLDENYLTAGYGRTAWELYSLNWAGGTVSDPNAMNAFTNYYTNTWQPQYKHLYGLRTATTDVWDWAMSYGYLYPSSPPTANWLSNATYADPQNLPPGASASITLGTPQAPVRSTSSALDGTGITGEVDDTLVSFDIEFFYEKLDELKEISTGASVTVAILDSGINRDELDANILYGYDFAGVDRRDGLSDEDYSDPTGHGTATASVIAATASEADLISAKIFDDKERTTSGIVAEAIKYAVDMGARILAMPLNLFPVYSEVEQAIEYALEKGVILITAAGNEGGEILGNSLASKEGIITVGSVDNDGKLSSWSNYDDELDLLAPWDVIENEAGTSFSASFVAGIAALMLSENPDMTAEDILEALKKMTAAIEEEKEEDKKDADEDKEEKEIKGIDVNEVVSKYELERKNVSEFTGYTIKEDVPESVVQE
ncbi:S8 family serine peptidase [Candidatus Omnitrophota bacterium]